MTMNERVPGFRVILHFLHYLVRRATHEDYKLVYKMAIGALIAEEHGHEVAMQMIDEVKRKHRKCGCNAG
jgi:hypothetical protein